MHGRQCWPACRSGGSGRRCSLLRDRGHSPRMRCRRSACRAPESWATVWSRSAAAWRSSRREWTCASCWTARDPWCAGQRLLEGRLLAPAGPCLLAACAAWRVSSVPSLCMTFAPPHIAAPLHRGGQGQGAGGDAGGAQGAPRGHHAPGGLLKWLHGSALGAASGWPSASLHASLEHAPSAPLASRCLPCRRLWATATLG